MEVRRAADLANIFYVRQKETKGLGHAIGRARRFVGDEPFAVLLGDDIMRAKKPVTLQLVEAAEKYGASALGVRRWLLRLSPATPPSRSPPWRSASSMCPGHEQRSPPPSRGSPTTPSWAAMC